MENRRGTYYLLSGLLMCIVSILVLFIGNRTTDTAQVVGDFQRKLLNAENNRDALLHDLIAGNALYNTDSLFSVYANEGSSMFEEHDMAIVAYRNGELIFWSNNDIPVSRRLSPGLFDQPFVYLENGWYDVKKQVKGEYEVIGFILVIKEYNHENEYLVNGIGREFRDDAITGVYTGKVSENAYNIYNNANDYLFALEISGSNKLKNGWLWLTIILLLLGFGGVIKAIEHNILVRQKAGRTFRMILFSLVLLLGRWVMIHFQLPDILYDAGLFDPNRYAYSYFFPSAGDLILNILLTLYIVYLLNKYLSGKLINRLMKHGVNRYVFLIISGISAFLAAWFITNLVKGGVENSTINFDVSDLFKLSYFSYLGLIAFGLLFFIYFMILNKLVDWLVKMNLGRPEMISAYTVLTLLIYLFFGSIAKGWHAAFEVLWSVPVFAFIAWFKKGARKNYSFSMFIIMVLLFSSIASVIISEASAKREINERRHLASKLAANSDPVAEYLFNEINGQLSGDTLLSDLISNYWMNEGRIREHLMKNYFYGYWDKFDFEFVGCADEDSILITPQNVSDHCLTYFNAKISNETEPTDFDGLHHMPDNNGISSYLGAVEFAFSNNRYAYLFIEFRSKPFIKSEGYPELLLGQKEIDRTLDLEDYSFARYQDGQLINSVGDYHYPMSDFEELTENGEVFDDEGFSHLYYQVDDNGFLLLSRKQDRIAQVTILFSFLFSLFTLVFFLLSILIVDFPVYYNFSFLSFGSKLQLILVGVILIVIIPFGIGVTYYIKKHYQERNDRNITEKLRSVLTEVEHKIGTEEYLPSQIPVYFEDYLNQILIKFSNVFYTDINLYGLNGQLLATSRSEIFDIGLKSKQMDLNAYQQLILDRKSMYIHTEKIGELTYLSAYVPFRNNENQLLAYLNLPYFAKQNELEKDLGSFLIALVNSYIFLIALAIIVAVVFADYLSRPLKLISSKIRQLKLGSENELIQWEGDDEIGELVHEYNRMVKELTRNVELLARSEREGAWREMAKQVAHEIKNPLTPMKLSVQHLKRAFDHNAENIHEQVNKVSNTLIEQIDSLTRIADEFSNFAKMPATQKEKLNVKDVLESSINLYREQSVKFDLTAGPETAEMKIEADRDQLMRAFNNIIKNAIQSIPEERKGEINVFIGTREGFIRVSISDNGKGISKEEQHKIFAPNFTTKSGGMGLGLAMVKNIVENSGGSVSFESTVGKGTSFYIEFPILPV